MQLGVCRGESLLTSLGLICKDLAWCWREAYFVKHGLLSGDLLNRAKEAGSAEVDLIADALLGAP